MENLTEDQYQQLEELATSFNRTFKNRPFDITDNDYHYYEKLADNLLESFNIKDTTVTVIDTKKKIMAFIPKNMHCYR